MNDLIDVSANNLIPEDDREINKIDKLSALAFSVYFFIGILCLVGDNPLGAIIGVVVMPFFYITHAVILIIYSFYKAIKTDKDGSYFVYGLLLLVIGLVMFLISFDRVAGDFIGI